MLTLGLWATPAPAARVGAVLSAQDAAYRELYTSLRDTLTARGHSVDLLDSLAGQRLTAGDERLIVAVGVRAVEAVAASATAAPVLAVLVPRQWYLERGRELLSAGGRRHASAIVVDQPPERQAALIRLALPQARRVGMIASEMRAPLVLELARALRASGLSPDAEILADGAALAPALERVLISADLLLAVPDPAVLNADTAQLMLLSSYRSRDPMLGYSRSLVAAGALLGLYSSPAQLGRQAGEWVADLVEGRAARLPATHYPRYFEIEINQRVARSLGVSLPSADVLRAALERAP